MPVSLNSLRQHITMHGAVFDIDISDFKCTRRESCILSIIILPENTGTDGLGLF